MQRFTGLWAAGSTFLKENLLGETQINNQSAKNVGNQERAERKNLYVKLDSTLNEIRLCKLKLSELEEEKADLEKKLGIKATLLE